MWIKIWTVVLVLVILFINAHAQQKKDIYTMTVPQLITKAGYPCEKHRVKTEDGYILQMHRIPAGRRVPRRSEGSNEKGKKAVLILHGLFGSSGDFVIMGPEKSLGFILADAGYDVWLGNCRGNVYSVHQNLTKNQPEFWDFSFHEHGLYDLTAMIDKILNVTKLPKILYIGYSMGTTSFFTMISERPEYNDKLISFVALAPAVYMDNIKPLASLAFQSMDLSTAMKSRGFLNVDLKPEIVNYLVGNICNIRRRKSDVCLRIIYGIVGDDYEQNDWDMVPVMIARFQPASWRQLEHFGKIAITGVFTSWEDGFNGAIRPYNLTNVRVPVSLLYGTNDLLTVTPLVQKLGEVMNDTGMLETVRPCCSYPKFNHLDFLFAKDVGDLLNRPLVKHVDELFDKYNEL